MNDSNVSIKELYNMAYDEAIKKYPVKFIDETDINQDKRRELYENKCKELVLRYS